MSAGGAAAADRGGADTRSGTAACDDGLAIDSSRLAGVFVDPAARTARVQGGARSRDVDRATQLVGLATAGGEVSGKTLVVSGGHHDLMLAFLDRWLGQRPVSEELKRALTGM